MDKFNKSDKKSLTLTHFQICCFSSPLSDRHQCRDTISKGDLISLDIGTMVVLRNAASLPFSPRFNSSVGAEKEISPQHPSHACSWPEPQLSEKMLMQALSVFSERRHALFKPASVWRRGGLPCRITLFTALIHIHRVACPSAALRRTDTSHGQWAASFLQHVMSPPPDAGPKKLNFFLYSASFDAAL